MLADGERRVAISTTYERLVKSGLLVYGESSIGLESAPDTFWEPWQPQVGQRVRIVRLAECRVALPDHCIGRDMGGDWIHDGQRERMTGTVVGLQGDAIDDVPNRHIVIRAGHRVVVSVLGGFSIGGRSFRHGYFAACELEPESGTSRGG